MASAHVVYGIEGLKMAVIWAVHCVVWWKLTHISEVLTTFVFRTMAPKLSYARSSS